jgi:hypothetical protein
MTLVFYGRINIRCVSYEFEDAILNCNDTAEPLRKVIATDCRYLSPGVDAIRFCPYPDPAPRSIYVYSLGRRAPVTHEALLRHCERERLWYVHDTINIHQPKQTDDPVAHRMLVANISKHSRCFVANSAKIDLKSDMLGRAKVGFRFFEGAAAGAVMFGEPPDTEVFRSLFDWPDAVVRAPYDSHDAPTMLSAPDREPERMSRIRLKNVVNSLLRHDWLHPLANLARTEPEPT